MTYPSPDWSPYSILNAFYSTGLEPVVAAILSNKFERMVQNIESNVDARATENGWAAVHFAAAIGDFKILRLLGACGADVRAQAMMINAFFTLFFCLCADEIGSPSWRRLHDTTSVFAAQTGHFAGRQGYDTALQYMQSVLNPLA